MSDIKTITAVSYLSDVQLASRQIQTQLANNNINFVLFYCSPAYPLPALALSLQALLPNIEVVGCTSAQEINTLGVQTHSIVAIGFSSDYFSISAELVKSMSDFDLLDAQQTINRLSERCASKALTTIKNNTFLLTLLDGLSLEEEHFLVALNSAAAGIPHFGGSAGGDINLCNTHIYFNGQFFQQAAVVIMINTTCAFEVFNCQHIKCATKKLVVTEVDVQSRTVFELNAEPAALEYARLLNMDVKDLCPQVFSLNPLAVKVGGEYFIRSIQKVNKHDLSLTFYCAVDVGIVLSAVELDDILYRLSKKLTVLSRRYGKPQLVLGCDCVLRRLEIEHKQLNKQMQDINTQFNISSFNTYGEHINGIHLNQTFTGVYIAGDADE